MNNSTRSKRSNSPSRKQNAGTMKVVAIFFNSDNEIKGYDVYAFPKNFFRGQIVSKIIAHLQRGGSGFDYDGTIAVYSIYSFIDW